MLNSPQFLFAYGTLMSTAGGAMGSDQRLRLDRETSPIRWPAVVAGRLYDLGRYPGLVESRASGEFVHGEVRQLLTPAATLAWLDAYEGMTPGGSPSDEYLRTEREAVLPDGRRLAAWVYVYAQPVIRQILIPSGRWISA